MPIYRPGQLPQTGISWVDALLRALHEDPTSAAPSPAAYVRLGGKGTPAIIKGALRRFPYMAEWGGGWIPPGAGSPSGGLARALKKPRAFKATVPRLKEQAPLGGSHKWFDQMEKGAQEELNRRLSKVSRSSKNAIRKARMKEKGILFESRPPPDLYDTEVDDLYKMIRSFGEMQQRGGSLP